MHNNRSAHAGSEWARLAKPAAGGRPPHSHHIYHGLPERSGQVTRAHCWRSGFFKQTVRGKRSDKLARDCPGGMEEILELLARIGPARLVLADYPRHAMEQMRQILGRRRQRSDRGTGGASGARIQPILDPAATILY